MLVTFHEVLWKSQNCGQEMVAVRNLLLEFWPRVASHVDLSPELGLGLPERGSELRESEGADDEQVHIARRMFRAARDGSVDEGDVNTGIEPLQQSLESRQQPGGLLDEATQVGEQRRSRIGLEVGPGAFAALFEDATVNKSLQVPLQSRRRRLEKLRQFRQVPPFIGLAQRRGKDSPRTVGKSALSAAGDLRIMRNILRELRKTAELMCPRVASEGLAYDLSVTVRPKAVPRMFLRRTSRAATYSGSITSRSPPTARESPRPRSARVPGWSTDQPPPDLAPRG